MGTYHEQCPYLSKALWKQDEEIWFLKEDKRYQQILERLREMRSR